MAEAHTKHAPTSQGYRLMGDSRNFRTCSIVLNFVGACQIPTQLGLSRWRQGDHAVLSRATHTLSRAAKQANRARRLPILTRATAGIGDQHSRIPCAAARTPSRSLFLNHSTL